MRTRKLSPFLLTVAIAVAIGSTSAWSTTEETSLLARLSSGDTSVRLQLAELYEVQNQRDLAIAQLEAAAGEGNEAAHALLAKQLASNPDTWGLAKHHLSLAHQGPETDAITTRMGVLAATRAIDKTRSEDERNAYSKDAERLLAQAVIAGNLDAKWHLGYLHVMSYVERPDHAGGMAMIESAADGGNSVAAHWLARLYEGVSLTGNPTKGMVVPTLEVKPYARKRSFEYLMQASALGNSLATKELASMYAVGSAPGGQDLERANRILASIGDAGPDLGDTLSFAKEEHSQQPRLINANLVITSAGQSSSSARASSAGEEAQLRIRLAEQEGTIEVLRRQLDAANARIAELESQLAEVAKYRALQENAADLNNRGMKFYLAGDYESALPLFRRASELEHSGAVANLALLYLNGYTVTQDLRQAQALLIRASEMGNVVATENLAELYETGAGLVKDPSRAISWYRRAQALGSTKAEAALQRLGAGPHR